jgi:hypothetical protein
VPLEGPIPENRTKELEKAKRLGRALTEIVRAHYNKVPLRNQRILADLIEKNHNERPKTATLNADVKWLEEQGWIKFEGISIELDKWDYQVIADSWCAEALFIAAELANQELAFPIREWRGRCTNRINSLAKERSLMLTPQRVERKCDEFLQEFLECEYVLRQDSETAVAHFNESRWNEDWFYLVIAKDSKLYRPFDKRQARPQR